MSSTSPWTSASGGSRPATGSFFNKNGGTEMQTVLARKRKPRPEVIASRRGLFTNAQGLATYLMLRPLSDLFLWAWRLERRLEFLYRPWFDTRLRPPLFSAAQALLNARRANWQLR